MSHFGLIVGLYTVLEEFLDEINIQPYSQLKDAFRKFMVEVRVVV